MDNDTQARLDRVREAARTLIEERDWFRAQADTLDAALRALGIDTTHANANPTARGPVKPREMKAPGKRVAYLSATEYRTNLEIAEEAITQHGGPLDIHALQVEMRKRGRDLGYSSVASLCSKGAAAGRLRRVGVGVYRVAGAEHELTSHLGEMPMREMDAPREAHALIAPVPAHLLTESPSKEPMNYLSFDPLTGRREHATDYHGDEDEHEGEGE